MLVWAIAGTATEVCGEYAPGTADREACELGEGIRTGLGIAALLFLWFDRTVTLLRCFGSPYGDELWHITSASGRNITGLAAFSANRRS